MGMPTAQGVDWPVMASANGSRLPAVETFLQRENLSVRAGDLLVDAKRQRLSALCYVEHDGRILMLRRNKEPFAGQWTAPGGKLLHGESPRDGARREVWEETNLALHTPELRLIASETGPEHYNWLLFFFRARPKVTDGMESLLSGPRETREGLLDWLAADSLVDAPIPVVERRLLPYIIAPADAPPYFARIHFDDATDIAKMDVRPLHRDNDRRTAETKDDT